MSSVTSRVGMRAMNAVVAARVGSMNTVARRGYASGIFNKTRVEHAAPDYWRLVRRAGGNVVVGLPLYFVLFWPLACPYFIKI